MRHRRAAETARQPLTTPLVARGWDETLAWFGGRSVTTLEYLGHVENLARELPDAAAVVNLCEDRYRFMVGFGAALVRGLPTLLPPNPLAATLEGIRHAWPGSVPLSDASVDCAPRPAASLAAGQPVMPRIADDLPAAVLYTSGSTGGSVAQQKSWMSLSAGARVNARAYLGMAAGGTAVVATVPPQHMYGLESTVMLALQGGAAAHGGRPFYPTDVMAALAQVPAPRMLVSTPVHLGALLRSGLGFPPLARVISATAPLDAALAAAVEQRCGADLIEVYGCTEVGSMAARRASRGARWRFFAGLDFSVSGESTFVAAAHLPSPVCLPDVLEFQADGSFALVGRNTDLIKVGGKRGSLGEVVRALLAIPGVSDAAALRLGDDADDARIAALYVADSLDTPAVRAALRRVLDPAFIPRPIRRVADLPRSATGKLPRSALLALLGESPAADHCE